MKRLGVSDLPECLKGDFLPKGEVGGGFLGALALSLALLRAVDPAEADAFRVLIVQNFDGVAFEHSHNSS